MINLPVKDKNGNGFLTYSQISTFLKSRNEYKKQYILKEPFFQNKYLKLGLKVGNALEQNDFSLFTKSEAETLSRVERLDLFEKKCFLNFDDFYLTGRIDTCSEDLTKIIDYKTGGLDKENQYKLNSYTQLQYYTLSIRQEYKINVKEASVIFIRRTPELKISNEDPIKIMVDISNENLKKVYWETIKIAKEIESFYENYLNDKN